MYQRQWLTALNFLFGLFLLGMAHGHSTIIIDQLKSNNNSLGIELFVRPRIIVDDANFRYWIVSVMILCMSPSSWVLAIFNRLLGRKKILSISVFIFFIAWITIAFAENATHILVGRALIGFSAGIFTGLAAVYQGECSIPKLRTTMNSIQAVALAVGIEVCHALSIWYHWRTIAFVASIVAVIALFLILNMPESPIWLLEKNEFQRAIHSWTVLRGIRDLEELKSMRERKLSNGAHSEKRSIARKYWTAIFWKPFGIMIVYFTVLQLSGMGAVMNYCTQVIKTIARPEHVHVATLILDTCRLLASVSLSVVTKRYSSRILTLYSALGTGAFLILLSASVYFEIWSPWSSLFCLFAYQIAVLGIMTLPWAFCGELFSASHKESAMGCVTSFNYLLFFVVVNRNPYLMESLESWGTFLLYGSLTLVGAIVLYFILPDTRNKTLKEIELMFSSR